MTLSMFQASVPVFIRMLGNLAAILEKGEAHARARNIDQTVLSNARLFPDMFPLSRQVQIACDIPKRGAVRLAGREPAETPDTEKTLTDLIRRVTDTREFLNGFSAADIDGSEDRAITVKAGGEDVEFSGQTFLLNFVLPNMYFHITTTYNILRHNGVELGKRDYLGSR